MQVLENPKKYDSGLYDSATGKNIYVEKVVDFSEDCPQLENGTKALFLFTRAKRGRIVVIQHTYPGKDFGSGIHFFVDELDKEMNVRPDDDTFGFWAASEFGFDKTTLRKMIEEQAPA